jgi:hypothetical protein
LNFILAWQEREITEQPGAAMAVPWLLEKISAT